MFVLTKSGSLYAGYNSATDKRILKDQYNKDVYCTKYKETIGIKESSHYCSEAKIWSSDCYIYSSWNPCYYIGQIAPDYKAYCLNHVYIGLTPHQCSKQSQVNFLELFFTIITIFE